MIWQDIIITIANLIFVVALLPQVISGFREKKGVISFATSIPTFIGLYAISFAFFTLGLYFSSVVSAGAATLWFLLFIERLIYVKKE